ncbi:CusA/CzcA family heavy metal efflux RND transporter [Sphingobacterium cavernae]|uniref:CusA/CzcA family heavy metal efflux RND transporter n=1 Tax=Sphingobacterium cavernae TaxID=2592657 RepID=UPI0012301925|nr:CusA/CzcA family heavy metal efflux RND transporter [Sphingobacterium cavernae]
MLHKIIEFSIRNKLIIGLFTLALVGWGVYETTKLPIDAQPDITNNQVQVITVAPSLGATDIERLVTFPIEQANSNINGITEIRSFSRFGLSLVTIVFDDETDVYWARQQVAERLQNVRNEIPEGVGTPELGPISTGLGEIYQYVIRPKKGYEQQFDATELRTIQDWIVRRQLLGVQGVAEVSSFGGKLKQYEIAVNSNKLQSLNLTISDVFTALENNNQNTGGAYIEKGPTVLYIRSEGLIGNKEDIENISVTATSDGIPVLLKDVAEVKTGYATRYGAMTYNDQGEVSGAIVMMLKGANSNEVIKNVKERIEIIRKTLPEGVVLEPFLDRTKMVNNAIGTIETNLAEGALIVVFVLVLFLGNFRAGLLVASVIPLAMLFAIIMMNLFGVSGNLMSLGALDFGLIVDGAVIIVEAVLYQLHYGKKFAVLNKISQKEMNKQVGSSATKMVNSAVFGQIIILIVYLPIFSLEGIEGKMFKPMAQTVAFALIGAFILSLTYIPMMSSLVLSKKIKHKPNLSDRLMERLEKLHHITLEKVLHFPKTIISIVVACFAVAVFILSNLGGEFIPALEEGDFAVDTRVLTGSNLQTTIDYTQKAAHILKTQYPEVEKVVTKIGSGEVPTDPMPMEASDMMVILKDKKEWTSAKTFPELAEKMGKSLEAVPGISTGFQYPVQMRFNELMTGARQDVVCKIFGEDLDSLASYANKFGEIIKTVDGAQDLYIEPVTGLPQVIIRYNRANIAQYNLNITAINKIVNTAFAGQSTGKVYEGEKRFDLIVRLDENQREKLEDIRNLLIPIANGNQIPLYQLADVSIQNGPAQIQREDAKRRIVVGFNVRGRDVQSIVNELQLKADKQLAFSPGYYVTYGGAFENLNQAKDRLMIAVPVSLILIFILLYFAFHSFKQSLLIYSAIPLSAIGGIFFLALRGMPFSISAGVGFIALFGVAVLNGIVLIAEFNRLRQAGETDLRTIVLNGTRTRLRPVLMTAFVASLGFMPMAVSNGAGAEVQRPLATVVIGGLMIATFLTLFVLPILYILFDKMKFPKLKFNKKGAAIVTFICLSTATYAQQISLEQAVDMAIKNNLSIKSKTLLSEYYQKRISTGSNIPQTAITGEFGQINSAATDNKFGVSQSISFPTVYSNQKNLLTEEWNSSVITVNLNNIQIKKTVTELFYYILVLREKEKILIQSDKMYAQFLEMANLSFDKGASNLLEKTAAEVQRENIAIQLKSLLKEIELAKIQLQLMLNAEERYEPLADRIIIENILFDPSVEMDSHPAIQLAAQEIQKAKANVKLEKSKLLPNLSIGYFNQSFADLNRNRFNSIEIGVGIPIFSKAQRSQIKAEEHRILFTENELAYTKAQWKTDYEMALQQFQIQQEIVETYRQKQLPGSEQIFKTAQEQFANGEINYLDWVMLNNQAIQIQSDYYTAVMQLNQSIINIHYFISK